MRPDDAPAFFKLLDDTYDMIGKSPAAKVISATAKALFFNDLKRYPLELIEHALSAHRLDPDRGRFTPTVADISSQIERRRPLQWVGADEAWASVPKLESEPAVLNQVTVQALAAAQPLLAEGDMIAARMAFKNCYDRLVARAKLDRVNPEYFLSPGGTFEDQEAVKAEAQRQGLLPAPEQVQEQQRLAGVSSANRAKLKALLLELKPKMIGGDNGNPG